MSVPVWGIVLTALLVAGFAAAGETVLRRRASDAFAWNQAFLVGAGSAAALLFPLSLVFPGRALDVLLGLLGLALLWAVAGRFRRRSDTSARPPWTAMDVLLVALVALAVGVALAGGIGPTRTPTGAGTVEYLPNTSAWFGRFRGPG